MQEKEICWNITARCNQNCRYCHRFLNIKELTFEEQKQVLENLISNNVSNITWTGGEALLIPNLLELIKLSHSNGIKNKLITNGKLLTDEKIAELADYLDSITLSIDSISNEVNESLGRGFEHFQNIKRILDTLKKYPNIKIRINSVASSYTKAGFKDLILFLNKYNIYNYRLFKFMPLREKAFSNQSEFDISLNEYDKIVKIVKKYCNAETIDTRVENDMENKYILILADGDIFVTKEGKDIKIGNALEDSISDIFSKEETV